VLAASRGDCRGGEAFSLMVRKASTLRVCWSVRWTTKTKPVSVYTIGRMRRITCHPPLRRFNTLAASRLSKLSRRYCRKTPWCLNPRGSENPVGMFHANESASKHRAPRPRARVNTAAQVGGAARRGICREQSCRARSHPRRSCTDWHSRALPVTSSCTDYCAFNPPATCN